MRQLLLLLSGTVWLASTVAANAAPFCVSSSTGKHCWYYSLGECLQAAGQDETCELSPEERVSGTAPLCAVFSSEAECYYWDQESCNQSATARNGICVNNPKR